MSDLSPEDEVALIAATVEPEVAAAVRAIVEEVAEPSGGSSSCSESADTVANEDARGLGVNGTKAKPAKNGAAAKKQSARRPLTPPEAADEEPCCVCKRPGTEMVCRHKDYPSCGKRFHVGCLDPAPPPELVGGDWLCPDCEEDACADCGGAGELLLCDDCPLAWHLHCLMPPLEAVRRRPPPPPRRRPRRPGPTARAPFCTTPRPRRARCRAASGRARRAAAPSSNPSCSVRTSSSSRARNPLASCRRGGGAVGGAAAGWREGAGRRAGRAAASRGVGGGEHPGHQQQAPAERRRAHERIGETERAGHRGGAGGPLVRIVCVCIPRAGPRGGLIAPPPPARDPSDGARFAR